GGAGAERVEGRGIQVRKLGWEGGTGGVDANVASAATGECMTSQVKFLHRGGRNAIEVAAGVKTMVHGIDVQVIDVEQYAAAGLAHQRGQEFPFGNFGALELEVTRDVLDQNLAAECVLHVANPCRGVSQCLLRVGQRQEVIQVTAIERAPREVLGYQHGLKLAHQTLELLQVISIERIC